MVEIFFVLPQGRESERHSAHHHNVINNNTSGSRRTKSKSTEDMNMGKTEIKNKF